MNKDKYNKRQEIIEHVFGTLKRNMNFAYFLITFMPVPKQEREKACILFAILGPS